MHNLPQEVGSLEFSVSLENNFKRTCFARSESSHVVSSMILRTVRTHVHMSDDDFR